jgi:hypothetical protein
MLKFGRVVDLDELEADADRSKEEEAEQAVREVEEAFQEKAAVLAKEIEELKESLANV